MATDDGFDLDAAIERVMTPWDLEVRMLGQKFKTRGPTVAEYGALLNMGNLTDEEGWKLLRSLFVPPLEKTQVFPTAWIQAFIVLYMLYFKSRSRMSIGQAKDYLTEFKNWLAARKPRGESDGI